jgi:GNAT superfamily N-acetyltransferase
MGIEVQIHKINLNDPPVFFLQVARIHIDQIHPGVLPLLGEKFLARLYYELARADQTHVWIALDGNRVLGFVCGCANVTRTYFSVFHHSAFRLVWLALPALISKALLGSILKLFLYPSQSGKRNLSDDKEKIKSTGAQLLSIAISTDAAGKGIGRRLVEALESSFIEWKSSGVYYVATWQGETDSNKFYRSVGFTPCGVFKMHDMLIQRYQKRIPENPEA